MVSEHSLPALWNVIYLNLSKHSKAKLKCDATRDKPRVVTDDQGKVPKQRRARVRDSNSPTTAHIHICKRETVYTTTIHFTIEFDGGNSDGTQEDQPGCRNLRTFPCTSAPSNTTRKTQCIFAGYIRRDQQSLVIRLLAPVTIVATEITASHDKHTHILRKQKRHIFAVWVIPTSYHSSNLIFSLTS